MLTTRGLASWLSRTVMLVACFSSGAPCFGFDSFVRPFEDLQRDPALRAQFQSATGRAALYTGHYEITKACLAKSQVQAKVAESIARTTSEIDYVAWNNPKRDYEPKRHCDRAQIGEDRKALTECLGYFRESIGTAWFQLTVGNVDSWFMKMLPRALHTQEDFFSHSNYVDLPTAEARESARQCWSNLPEISRIESLHDKQTALWKADFCTEQDAPWISEIRLTGYKPGVPDPYAPPDDPYPHQNYAKDNPAYSGEALSRIAGGSTKYEAARDAAIETCVATVDRFRALCRENALCMRSYSRIFVD